MVEQIGKAISKFGKLKYCIFNITSDTFYNRLFDSIELV